MASDDHDTAGRQVVEMNLNGPENGKRCGRKKSKPIDHGTLKKKQPQRGMGVAQLERLRWQERWKEMTEINPNANPLHSLSQQNHPFQFGGPTPTRFRNLGTMNGSGLNQAPLYLQRLGNGGFLGAVPTSEAGILFPDQFPAVDPYRIGASNPTSWLGNVNIITETSKELSSVPNMKCFSEHCGVCHKKKRQNGETLGCNGVLRKVYPEIAWSNSCGNFMGLMNAGNNCNINEQNHVFGKKLPMYQSYAGSKMDLQEAEVRAVHRKGNSGGGSSGNAVTEYDFFPGKSSSTCFEEWISLGSESSSSSSVAVGLGAASCLTTTANTSTAVFGAASTSCIDLSLKLSY